MALKSITKFGFAVLVAAQLCATSAYAQNSSGATTSQDTIREFRAPAPITPFFRPPPMPTQLCVFTRPKYQGRRTCYDPQEMGRFPHPGFNRVIWSFTIPYGYEVDFYNDVRLDAPDTPVELLCTYRQTSPHRFSRGIDSFDEGHRAGDPPLDGSSPNGFDRCVGPVKTGAMATKFSFRKMATITDAQRAAVWAGWEINDNDNCGVRIYPTFIIPDTARANPRTLSDRANCFGFRTNMTDLSTLIHERQNPNSNLVSLKEDFGEVRISSRYAKLELFERPNFQGRFMRLGCGNYRFSPAMATQIGSAWVQPLASDTYTPASNCSNVVQTISSWDRPLNPMAQPFAPRAPRP